MGEDELMQIRKQICNHFEQRRYTQKRLDILNGFELILIRCINCHKVLNLEARKIKKAPTISNKKNNWVTKSRNFFKNMIQLTRKKINNMLYWIKNLRKQY
jgi:hypothetical protein